MAWDWGRVGRGIATGGLSELMREQRTDNEWKNTDRNNFNLPGAQQRGDRLLGMANQGAPQSSFRATQDQVMGHLRGQMLGQNSLSREQLRRDAGANIAAQQALAASGRPGNAALAARMASQNAGRTATALSGNTAMAGIAERNAAAQALGGLASEARGQDINAQLGQGQLNQGYAQLELDNARAQQQGGIQYENNQAQRFGVASQQPTMGEQYLGLIQGGAGAAMAMSDKRAKTNVQPGDAAAKQMMDAVEPKTYSYRPGVMLPGELDKTSPSEGTRRVRTGVMAQDLEKSAAGKAAVVDTPAGKVVNYGQLAGAMMAALGNLNGRVKKVEGKR